jgi:hypothetical protein
MATIRQIEANRRNSQSSTGPRTPEGKAVVRFNALKSGIDAESQVIPGEDPEVFQTFAAEFTQSCHPADAREQELVDQLIDDAWRLRRLRKAESQIWTGTMQDCQKLRSYREETSTGDTFRTCESLTRLQRLVTSIKRSYHQAGADLDRLQAARAKSAEPQPLTPDPVPPPQIAEQSQFDPAEPASEASHTTPTPNPHPQPLLSALS